MAQTKHTPFQSKALCLHTGAFRIFFPFKYFALRIFYPSFIQIRCHWPALFSQKSCNSVFHFSNSQTPTFLGFTTFRPSQRAIEGWAISFAPNKFSEHGIKLGANWAGQWHQQRLIVVSYSSQKWENTSKFCYACILVQSSLMASTIYCSAYLRI